MVVNMIDIPCLNSIDNIRLAKSSFNFINKVFRGSSICLYRGCSLDIPNAFLSELAKTYVNYAKCCCV